MTQSQLLFVAIPAIFALFATAMGTIAMVDRGVKVARWGAIAFAMAAVGLLIGMFRPPGAWWGLIYVHLAVLACYGQAMAVRVGGRVPWMMLALLLATGIAATLLRVADVQLNLRYIVFHLGTAASLLVLAIYQLSRHSRRRSDRLMIGATIFLFLTYAARVVLLLVFPLADSVAEQSSFFDIPANIVFNLIMALGGVVAGLTLIIAMGWDSISIHSRRSRTDALTGLGNRFALRSALRQARRGEWACSGVIALDLDHFKTVNDRHGHAVGDRLLRATGRVIREVASDQCEQIRAGGEEFLVLTCDLDGEGVALLAERLRREIGAIRLEQAPALTPSVSAGYCEAHAGMSLDAMIQCADRALYAAKENGRDRVEGTPDLAFA